VASGRYIAVIILSAYVDCVDKVQTFLMLWYIYLPLLGDVYGCDTWSVVMREEHRLRVFGSGASLPGGVSEDSQTVEEMFVCLVRTAALRFIARSWLDVPTFATRRLHACHHARAPSGGRWNCGREMSGNFALMPTYTLHLGVFYMP
jgi:hypothetical protein